MLRTFVRVTPAPTSEPQGVHDLWMAQSKKRTDELFACCMWTDDIAHLDSGMHRYATACGQSDDAMYIFPVCRFRCLSLYFLDVYHYTF
jgi:hypothetical protein